MRLKITRELHGSIDGIQLRRFEPGEVYEFSTSLGSYLLAEGAAEPAADTGVSSSPRDRADARPCRKSRVSE